MSEQLKEHVRRIRETHNQQEIWLRRVEAELGIEQVKSVPPLHLVDATPWLTVARKEIGTKEIVGASHNPRVLEYLASVDKLGQWAKSQDETYWCAAFVGWCLEQSGYPSTELASARSYLQYGTKLDAPVVGCIVVFSRGDTGGHVAFYLGEDGDNLRVLGGNQHNKVCEALYPKARVLGYRMPGLVSVTTTSG